MRARGWRGIAILTVMVIAAGVVIALLQPSASSSYLDPNGTFLTGGHALADLLADRGQRVIRSAAPSDASPGTALELLTSPQLLTSAQLAEAARFNGDILLIAPDSRALRALAQRVSIVGPGAGLGATQPACTAQPATLAGDADRKQMFGYPSCVLRGNMFMALHEDSLILRLAEPDRAEFLGR